MIKNWLLKENIWKGDFLNTKGFMSVICLLFILAGCSDTEHKDTKAVSAPENKYEKLVKEKNKELAQEPIKQMTNSEGVVLKLKQPLYKEFAVNGQLIIEGEIEESSELKSDYVWIKALSDEQEPAGGQHDYYTPLKDGKFKQTIHFFNGEGMYDFIVQVPSKTRDNYYYHAASFSVFNVHPDYQRDVTYTPFGQENLVTLDVENGFQKADGIFKLTGHLEQTAGKDEVMVALTKEGETWKNTFAVKDGRIDYDIPLFYGKGLHKLEVLLPDDIRDNYYLPVTTLLIDNQSSTVMKPIEYYSKTMIERGFNLDEPKFGGSETDQTFQIKGSFDSSAELAAKTDHLYISTVKGDDHALDVIPVEDFSYDDSFYLRFGPGTYEVTVSVPEITEKKTNYFRYFSVAQFEVDSTEASDQRDLLPSRGVQSNDAKIIKLAESIVKGKKSEREKSKAIYDYVAKNIAYDVEKFKTNDFNWDDSALKTLQLKDGVCQDYAYLAIALLRANHIEARFVEGYAPQKHAWVEAKIDGKWLTMDPTWGAGYIQNNVFVKKYTDTYFDPNMKEFKKTHKRTGISY